MPMRAPSDIPSRLGVGTHRGRLVVLVAIAVLLVLLASAQRLASLYTDLLWFRSVGLSSVWVKTLTVQFGLGVVFSLLMFGLVWGNLVLADRLAPNPPGPTDDLVARWQLVMAKHRAWLRLGLAVLFAGLGGASAHSQWDNWLLFSNAKSFTGPGSTDPLFHLNNGFYVFELPFLSWFVNWLFSALVVALLLSLVAHYLNGGIRPHVSTDRVGPRVKAHVSVLLAAMVLTEGANYYLQRLSLVLSTRYPPVDGATYTDVHAVGPALLLLVAISAIAAGLFLYNVRRQGWVLPISGVVLWGVVWALVANVYPAIVQSVVVKPSQNVKEQPYIQDNINATTAAYGLGGVTTQTFQGSPTIAPGTLTGGSAQAVAYRQSLANVALLDAGTADINKIFTRLQGFRGYFTMSGPSIDRYDLVTGTSSKAQETPVLISARELNSSGAPQTWVNQHLEFTHGYGAVVAPADQAGITSAGYPNFSLSDIPTTGQPALNVQPRVYFGTNPGSTQGYIIAGSNQPEVDYQDPATNAEATNHYNGNGGVPAGGFFRRLAFAVSFGDANFLLSGQVTSTSRVLYYRNVVQRLHQAAPFLAYDSHPYPVILSGRLYWVEDAYTTTDNYPYSQQANTGRLPGSGVGLGNQPFNYVRNSVKAVVDAYTGRMWFFVADPTDPVVQAYESAFPRLFTPMSRANADIPGITSHWRYPRDLFTVQTNMYATYHQQQASVFYTSSLAWGIPQDPAASELSGAAGGALGAGTASSRAVSPVYELTALPGQAPAQQSFVLVQPFAPASSGDKPNLTAFMTASSDPNDYGQLTVYTIPAGHTVYGPSNVANAVLTNTAISEEISLLDQNGSKVVLGNLAMVPLGQTLLYFQPLYVEPSTSNQGATAPRLADVIVVYDGKAFDSGQGNPPTVYGALCRVQVNGVRPFAALCPAQAPQPSSTGNPPTASPGRSRQPSSTTTTTTPRVTRTSPPVRTTTTGVPVAAGPGAVAHDLQVAEQDFALAKAALAQGDLGTYQADVQAGEAAVALATRAQPRASGPTSTTTRPTTTHPTTTTATTSTTRPTTRRT
jgi:hypothetical protein